MKEETKKLLRGLFVPRDEGLEGVCFAPDYMKEENTDKRAIYESVSGAMRESGLSFNFAYEIAERAVDILLDMQDDDEPDDYIPESADAAVPVYTADIMKIYVSDWNYIDEVEEELGGNDEGTSEQRARVAYFIALERMTRDIYERLTE